MPGILLYDYAAAFPSVAHYWLFATLRARGMPAGAINFVKFMYTDVRTYTLDAGLLKYAFNITAGVLQGCPCSGMLFAVVADPILRAQKEAAGSDALLRACADDLGHAFRNMSSLAPMADLFLRIERVSNLKLKPTKCALILLVEATKEIVMKVKCWLMDHVPSFGSVKICNVGTYLGFAIGPKADSIQWAATMSKWKGRAEDIAASGATSHIASLLYNIRAASVIPYKCQLIEWDQRYSSKEPATIERVLHLAHNALPQEALFRMEEVGGPKFTNLRATSKASMVRFAATLRNEIDSCAKLLLTGPRSQLRDERLASY